MAENLKQRQDLLAAGLAGLLLHGIARNDPRRCAWEVLQDVSHLACHFNAPGEVPRVPRAKTKARGKRGRTLRGARWQQPSWR
eukprot:924991-Lingulodinium_polyedra.AAC.1